MRKCDDIDIEEVEIPLDPEASTIVSRSKTTITVTTTAESYGTILNCSRIATRTVFNDELDIVNDKGEHDDMNMNITNNVQLKPAKGAKMSLKCALQIHFKNQSELVLI